MKSVAAPRAPSRPFGQGRLRRVAGRVSLLALAAAALTLTGVTDAVIAGRIAKAGDDQMSSGTETVPVAPNETLPTGVADLLPLAQKGNLDAQNRLGVLYVSGKGVPKDIPEGIKWLRSAADKGQHAAQLNMGMLYQEGVGVAKDYAEAAKWFQLSAAQNDAGAENGLGFLYEHGLGVVQNYADALTWYRKAAEQHNDIAQFNLALMYERGEGVDKDQTEAVRLMRIAAEKGFPLAQVGLANHYLSGMGIGRDPLLAYFWSVIGSAHVPPNQSAAAMTIRENAARLIGPNEVNRLQNLAMQWKSGMDAAALMNSSPPAPGSSGTGTVRMSGTGFVVAKNGFVLTNAHVVPFCKTLTVRGADETEHAATVVNRDEHVDLALLKADGEFAHVSTFREDRGIRQGDSIVAYGFPLTGLLSDQGNLTTGTVSALAGMGNDSRLIQISAPVQPGNSGGPVVDTSGNVVAVVVSKLNALNIAKVTGDMAQNINFAIKENVARDFLEANNVAYATAKSVHTIQTPDLAQRMKAYTVLVLCGQ